MTRRLLTAAAVLPVLLVQQCAPECSPAPAGATPGNCASFTPLFEEYGLPAATFRAIAWRESGCNPGVTVFDSDDSGGGLLGLNLKGAMAGYWRNLCGLTLSNVTDAETNIRCAAAAYRTQGLAPWR